MKSLATTFTFLTIIWITACGPATLYDETKPVPKDWHYNDPIGFNWEASDTSITYDLILEVSYNDSFAYQNIYVKLQTTMENGSTIDDMISLELRDNRGETHGKCSGNLCKVPFIIQSNVAFKETGKYQLNVRQHTRDSLIRHIEALHFTIKNSKDEN